MPMPGPAREYGGNLNLSSDGVPSSKGAPPGEGAKDLPPPPNFGKQMAQLVIIPAVIALIAIGLFAVFGSIAAAPDSMSDQLNRLRQSSGMGGNLIGGAQDPRYKDRCHAANHIAEMIATMEDPAERRRLSDELIKILSERVHPDEAELMTFMVMALGRLAQPGGLEAVMQHGGSNHARVREGVVGAVMNWSVADLEAARAALPMMTKLLADPNEPVRTQAAAAMWNLTKAGDTEAIAALREAMASFGRDPDGRDFAVTRRHAAMALAALGDEEAIVIVADTLLNRAALAEMSADVTGKTDTRMNAGEQERVIAMTLHFIARMKDPRIWERVKELADKDPSVNVRKAASQLLQEREKAR